MWCLFFCQNINYIISNLASPLQWKKGILRVQKILLLQNVHRCDKICSWFRNLKKKEHRLHAHEWTIGQVFQQQQQQQHQQSGGHAGLVCLQNIQTSSWNCDFYHLAFFFCRRCCICSCRLRQNIPKQPTPLIVQINFYIQTE